MDHAILMACFVSSVLLGFFFPVFWSDIIKKEVTVVSIKGP